MMNYYSEPPPQLHSRTRHLVGLPNLMQLPYPHFLSRTRPPIPTNDLYPVLPQSNGLCLA